MLDIVEYRKVSPSVFLKDECFDFTTTTVKSDALCEYIFLKKNHKNLVRKSYSNPNAKFT